MKKSTIFPLEAELPSGTGIVAMLHDELVIETDVSIAEEMLTLAKQKMEESAGLVFKDVPMLVEGKIIDSWE
jgi:DNA polymerase I-like protein with 3'-5' exonuclease and polymerase domains